MSETGKRLTSDDLIIFDEHGNRVESADESPSEIAEQIEAEK